ncbi:MAG: hypothetical protein V1735_07440 [Nanoarchaeota archaeon]
MNYKRLPMMIPLAGALALGAAGCGGLEKKVDQHDRQVSAGQMAPREYHGSANPIGVERTAGNTWDIYLGDDVTHTNIPVHNFLGEIGVDGEVLTLLRAYENETFPDDPEDQRAEILKDPDVKRFIFNHEVRQGRRASLDLASNYERAAEPWDIMGGIEFITTYGEAISYLRQLEATPSFDKDMDTIRYVAIVPQGNTTGLYADTQVKIYSFSLAPLLTPQK